MNMEKQDQLVEESETAITNSKGLELFANQKSFENQAAVNVDHGSQLDNSESLVAVSIRVRPHSEDEISAVGDISNWRFTQNQIMAQSNHQHKGSAYLNSGKVYSFNQVFSPVIHNKNIYDQLGAHIVERVLKGYNGTIFAYGQTGTGKTHTVLGPKVQHELDHLIASGLTEGVNLVDSLDLSTPDDNDGILVHALRHVFSRIDEISSSTSDELEEESKGDNNNGSRDQKREFSVQVAYMEIYKEQINDLLRPKQGEGVNLRVTHDHPVYGAVVEGLTFKTVHSAVEAVHHVVDGESRRHIASTGNNEKSSRSHSVFRVIVRSRLEVSHHENNLQQGTKPLDEHVRVSCLNIVDLAGSERQGLSLQVNRSQLSEGNAINKSLLSLREVIYRLARSKQSPKRGKGYIPYRGSKLTRLLKQSLGGNACTSMICTISPSPVHEDESMNTIKFGALCSTVENAPVVNEVALDNDQKLLEQYKSEIDELKREMQKRADEHNTMVERSRRLSKLETTRGAQNPELRAAKLLQSAWRKFASRRLAKIRLNLLEREHQAEELQRTMKMMWIDQIDHKVLGPEANTPRHGHHHSGSRTRKSSALLKTPIQISTVDMRSEDRSVGVLEEVRRRSLASADELGSKDLEDWGRNRSASFSQGDTVAGYPENCGSSSSPGEESLLRLDEVRMLLRKKTNVERQHSEQYHEELEAERRRATLAETEAEQLRNELEKVKRSEDTYRQHLEDGREELERMLNEKMINEAKINLLEEQVFELQNQLQHVENSVAARKEDWDKHDIDLQRRHKELSDWEQSMKEWHERSTTFNRETEEMAHTLNQEKLVLEHTQAEVNREKEIVQQEWKKMKQERDLIRSEMESLDQERGLLDRIQTQVLAQMQTMGNYSGNKTKQETSPVAPQRGKCTTDENIGTYNDRLLALDEAIRRFAVLEVQLTRKRQVSEKQHKLAIESTRQCCLALISLVKVVHQVVHVELTSPDATNQPTQLPAHHPAFQKVKQGSNILCSSPVSTRKGLSSDIDVGEKKRKELSRKDETKSWNTQMRQEAKSALSRARDALSFAKDLGIQLEPGPENKGISITKSLDELRSIANRIPRPLEAKETGAAIHYDKREPRVVHIDLVP